MPIRKLTLALVIIFCSTTYAAQPALDNAPSAVSGLGTVIDQKSSSPQPNFTIGYNAEVYVAVEGPNTGTYNYVTWLQNVSASYFLNSHQYVELLAYFSWNMINSYSGDEWGSGDTAIQYARDDISFFDKKFSTYARFYVPTSEYTILVGAYQLSLASQFTQPSSNFDLIYAMNIRLYSYLRDQTGQRYLRAVPSLTLRSNTDNIFQPYFTLGEDSDWRYSSDGANALVVYNNGYSLPASSHAHFDLNNDLAVIDLGTRLNFNRYIKANLFYEWYHFWHAPSQDALGDGAYEFDLSVEI